MHVEESLFGYTAERQKVFLYSISNNEGMSVKITNYGGIITSIKVPDKSGKQGEVVLGFDKLNPYLEAHPYFGAIIGRVANRIRNSQFALEGKSYQISKNDGKHHLHGGHKGFDKVIWKPELKRDGNLVLLELDYLSEDGEEGYPGNVQCKTTFVIYPDNRIDIRYNAESDQTTIINLTHHDYFNLKDGGVTTILDHHLMINAESFTVADKEVIVSGEIKHVNESFNDFRNLKMIGQMIVDKDGAIVEGKGYDQNFILNKRDASLGLAAILREKDSGRQLMIKTTQDCMQLYTSSHLQGNFARNEASYRAYHGICLECQSFPDAVNHDHFPGIVLHPGEKYSHSISYRFSQF